MGKKFSNTPWRYGGAKSDIDTYIYDSNGDMVAQVRGWGNLQRLGEQKAIEAQRDRGLLMAASPELHAALEDVFNQYQINVGPDDQNARTVQLAKSALKKARGEE